MSEFRPTVAETAPRPFPLRRWAAFGVAALLLAALSLSRGETPRADAEPPAPRAVERSAWDDAIASLTGGAPAITARVADMPGRPALAALLLEPHVVNGEVAGYAIGPGELPEPLLEAGLRPGDILTTIDGLPLDAARAQRLGDEFGGLDEVEVNYRRGGELRDTLIVFRER